MRAWPLLLVLVPGLAAAATEVVVLEGVMDCGTGLGPTHTIDLCGDLADPTPAGGDQYVLPLAGRPSLVTVGLERLDGAVVAASTVCAHRPTGPVCGTDGTPQTYWPDPARCCVPSDELFLTIRGGADDPLWVKQGYRVTVTITYP